MGSKSNPNPWSPYDSYNDCSQGICNMYCPQWCYFLFPPPPPPSSSSSTSLSPLLIALISILVSAFILISYYTLISKYCHRHHSSSSSSESPGRDGGGFFSTEARRGDGLNDSLIKSITVYKYRKGDGFVECSDCSVCLSEFEEDESLRLLPKCNHAFHLPCIDTWLKSHSNCPLCRAFVTPEVDHQQSSVHQITTESSGGVATEMSSSVAEHRAGDSVLVIDDLEMNINNGSHPKPPEEEEHRQQPIRRSVSLNSGLVLSTGDVLRDVEEDDKEIRCSVALKRSVSAGRFIFSRGPRDYSLPN